MITKFNLKRILKEPAKVYVGDGDGILIVMTLSTQEKPSKP